MNIIKAWDIVNKHSFFVRPYYDSYNIIYTFSMSFHDATYIYPIEENGKVYWICEFGCWSIDNKSYYRDYENWHFTCDSYEECIIKLAEYLVDRYGEDDYNDYNMANLLDKIREYGE